MWRDDPDTAYLDDDLGGMAVVAYALTLCGLLALCALMVALVMLAHRIG